MIAGSIFSWGHAPKGTPWGARRVSPAERPGRVLGVAERPSTGPSALFSRERSGGSLLWIHRARPLARGRLSRGSGRGGRPAPSGRFRGLSLRAEGRERGSSSTHARASVVAAGISDRAGRTRRAASRAGRPRAFVPAGASPSPPRIGSAAPAAEGALRSTGSRQVSSHPGGAGADRGDDGDRRDTLRHGGGRGDLSGPAAREAGQRLRRRGRPR